MIQIYGNYTSRTLRCLWMLEELALDYELIEIDHRTNAIQTEEYAKVNPNQTVPTLVDENFVLWESMAINLYLADRYDGGFRPKSPEAAGKSYQWIFWAMMELEHLLLTALRHRAMYPEEHRDPAKADEAEAALHKPLRVLNDALADRNYLVEEGFGVADLNVACIVGWSESAKVSLAGCTNIGRWLDSCRSRTAWRRVQDKSPSSGLREYRKDWKFE